MRLAAMYGVIAAVAQQFYERCAYVGVWSACHLRNAVDVPVGTVNHVAREVNRLVAFEFVTRWRALLAPVMRLQREGELTLAA